MPGQHLASWDRWVAPKLTFAIRRKFLRLPLVQVHRGLESILVVGVWSNVELALVLLHSDVCLFSPKIVMMLRNPRLMHTATADIR